MAAPLAVHWAAVTFCWRVLAIGVRGPPVTARVRTDADSRLGRRRRGDLIHREKHLAGRFALREARCGAIRPGGETPPSIFGPVANAGWTAGPETERATRPWRIHAETFVRGSGARTERCARAARPRGRIRGHLQRSRQGIAGLRWHQLDVGDRRRLSRDVHAGRLRLPRDRILA